MGLVVKRGVGTHLLGVLRGSDGGAQSKPWQANLRMVSVTSHRPVQFLGWTITSPPVISKRLPVS